MKVYDIDASYKGKNMESAHLRLLLEMMEPNGQTGQDLVARCENLLVLPRRIPADRCVSLQ